MTARKTAAATKKTSTSKATTTIDLDAARAARREKRGRIEVVFLGEKIALPPGLNADVMLLIETIDTGSWSSVMSALEAIIGETAIELLLEAVSKADDVLEVEDVLELLEKTMTVYGISLPESEASES